MRRTAAAGVLGGSLPLLGGLRPARAQELPRISGKPTFLILSMSGSGHPLNSHCPGSYANPSDANDVRQRVRHPTESELGTKGYGVVGGVEYGAADFATGFECRLGDELTLAARPWAELPEGLRNRMSVVRHQTYTSAHPEFRNVSEFHGAVKGRGRIGSDSFPSMIADETASALGTVVSTPYSVLDRGTGLLTGGNPIRNLSPDELFDLYATEPPAGGLETSALARYRDAAYRQAYGDIRDSGTHAQRAFLGKSDLSRQQAALLGDSLRDSVAPIGDTNDRIHKQVLAAVALIEQRVTPCVILDFPFGGDNHQDLNLEVEVTESLQGIEGMRLLYTELQSRGLVDDVTFGYLGSFGRDIDRATGGRGHHGQDHTMMMWGPNIAPGLHGGLIEQDGRLVAGPIGDISISETLSAAGKTLAKACGLSDEVIEERIVGGRPL